MLDLSRNICMHLPKMQKNFQEDQKKIENDEENIVTEAENLQQSIRRENAFPQFN